jgi:hypothetical protein
MADIAYPSGIPTFLRQGKSRSQPAAFRLNQPRRGTAFAEASGNDTPVFWDVDFRFTQLQAQTFLRWFRTDLQRGVLPFTMPIRTEFGLQVHLCQFLPDSLLNTTETAGLWNYSAKLMARELPMPAVAPAV